MIDFLTSPLDTDLAYSWIKAIFPESADQPYGQAFAIFTSSLTFLGTLFMGWHVIIGIVNSAYSGKVLGERYHQIWAPLRVVLGFGMLVPIAGGFSTVHYLLRDVVGVAAVQMANIPITRYIHGMASNPPGLSPAAMQGRTVAEQVISLQACAATVEGFNRVVNPYVMTSRARIVPTVQDTGNGYRWDYGDCGSLFLSTPTPGGDFAEASADRLATFAQARAVATQRLMTDLSKLINHAKFGEFFATKAFDEKMGPAHARELRHSGVIPGGLIEHIDAAAAHWDSAVSDAARAVFADADTAMRANLIDRIRKYGFMVAGSYERTLSQLSAMAVSLAADQPVTVLGDPGYRYSDAYKGGQAAVVVARQLGTRETGIAEGATPEDGAAAADYVASAVAPMLRPPPLRPDSADPVGDMIARGHWLVTGAQAGVVTLAVAHSVGEGTSQSLLGLVGGGALAGAINYLSNWISYAIMISLLVGIMHAYVLPMIPMIMVFVMGVSWLVLFLEAAIAGVLWAFAFIRMDGQAFFDRNQAPGATLLFNLFLRPAIGMLAFIGGLILMPHLLNGLAVIWDDAFAAQTEVYTINYVIGQIVGMVMFMWLQWHLYLRVWGLVPTIADRVGFWMGMQTHGYNDGAETQAAAGAMVAAGAAMAKTPLTPGAAPAARAVASTMSKPEKKEGDHD